MTMCKMFHEKVRELSEQYLKEAGRINYVTPTSYLELITAFTTLLATKRAEVGIHGPGTERWGWRPSGRRSAHGVKGHC